MYAIFLITVYAEGKKCTYRDGKQRLLLRGHSSVVKHDSNGKEMNTFFSIFSLFPIIENFLYIQGDPKFSHSEYRTWYFVLKETTFFFAKLRLTSSFCKRAGWSYTSKRKNYLSNVILLQKKIICFSIKNFFL